MFEILYAYYKLNEIASWGTEFFFIQLIGKTLRDKYLISDRVYYINPNLLYKDIKIREIDTCGLNEKSRKNKMGNICKKSLFR